MENNATIQHIRRDDQDYVTDFWDTFSREEKAQLIKEGYKAPNKRCELFVIDFIALKDLIYHEYI